MKIIRARLIEKQSELLSIAERFRDTCVYTANGHFNNGDDEGLRLSMFSAEMTECTIAYLTNRAPRDLWKERSERLEKQRLAAEKAKKGGAA